MAAPSKGCWTQIPPHPVPEPLRRGFACSPGDWPSPARSIPSPGKCCWRQSKVRASPRTGLSAEVAQGSREVLEGRGRTERGLSPLQVVSHNHLLQFHNVGVLELQEQGDLPQAADGHSWGGKKSRAAGMAWSQSQSQAWRQSSPVPPAPPLPSFSLSIRTFFSATVSSVSVSRARSGGNTGHIPGLVPASLGPLTSATGRGMDELQAPPDPNRAGILHGGKVFTGKGQG